MLTFTVGKQAYIVDKSRCNVIDLIYSRLCTKSTLTCLIYEILPIIFSVTINKVHGRPQDFFSGGSKYFSGGII